MLGMIGSLLGTGLQVGADVLINKANREHETWLNEQNIAFQRETNAKNEALMRESWLRDDNAVQRRTKDLEAAGMSPLLAAGSAAGNSGTVSMQSPEAKHRSEYRSPQVGAMLQQGETSFNPDYVKQILTSLKWQANTTYAPYQYVQPTNENGFQYVVIDGGKSASVEPTWPTTIGLTVSDGTVEWKCVAATDRLPLVIGQLDNGDPAVFIDTAFIKNASITSAKISELIADKIETGKLIADIQVKNKLWYGFNLPNGDFLDPEDNTVTSGKTGFYLGVNGSGSLPVLHLNTGIANGSRQFLFDGTQLTLKNVDLVSSADGEFDDLGVDSLTANRAYALDLGFRNLFAVSNYVQLDAEGRPIIDDVDVRSYFCWIYGCKKTVSYVTPSDKIILVGNNNRGGVRLQTYDNLAVVPYDYANLNTKYRMKKKAIAFSIKITIPLSNAQPFYLSLLRIYLFDQTMGFASNLIEGISKADLESGYAGQYLAMLNLRYDSSNKDHFTNMLGANLFDVEVLYQTDVESSYFLTYSPARTGTVIINCFTDNESLNYVGLS